QLRSLANARSREKSAVRAALESTLLTYQDATEQQVRDLARRADQLQELQAWLTGSGLPQFGQAAQAVTRTAGRLDELTAEQRALAAVRTPPDVAALDADIADAASSLAAATGAQDAAETADTVAAEKVRSFRPRHELLALRQQWEDLARTTAHLPVLRAD